MAENTRTWCAMEAEVKAILVHNKVSDDCMQKYVQQFAATTAKRRCTVYKGMILAKFLSLVRTTPISNRVLPLALNVREIDEFFDCVRERLLGEQFQKCIIFDMLTDMKYAVKHYVGGWVVRDGVECMIWSYMYRMLHGHVHSESPEVALQVTV